MDINGIINNIRSKEDFVKFLNELKYDKEHKSEDWTNQEISSYLDGIASWVEDMEGYFNNMSIDMPTNIDWKFISTLFYVGKIYE